MEFLKNNLTNKNEILKAYSQLIKPIAVANLLFDIKAKESFQILNEELIQVASERNPTWKNTKIGTVTGIDRKLIPNILNQTNNVISASPLQETLFHMNKLCESEGTDSIKIKGDIISFKSIVDQQFKGQHSYKSILEEGIEKKCFEIKGNYVFLVQNHIQYASDPKEYLEYLGMHLQLIMDTGEFNFKEPNRENKKVQNSNWTTNIKESLHPEVEKEMLVEINKCKDKINNILEKWEKKSEKSVGKGDKQFGTFNRIGCFFNIFSSRKHDDEYVNIPSSETENKMKEGNK